MMRRFTVTASGCTPKRNLQRKDAEEYAAHLRYILSKEAANTVTITEQETTDTVFDEIQKIRGNR